MKKILLLILEGAELLEIAPFTDVFGWHNALKKQNICLVTAGISADIRCCWNLKITPELILKEGECLYSEFDALIIPGGFGSSGYFTNLNTPLVKEIILHFKNSNKLIVGICTGSILLGEYGALAGKKATTYLSESGRYFNQLEKLGAIPISQEIVTDDNLITSSAPGSAAKVAFKILEIFSDQKTSSMIKNEMGFEF